MHLNQLKSKLQGDLLIDDLSKRIYATDASAYREIPSAIALPKDEEDLKTLIHWANENSASLIPRTGGTSLAGQVVGSGVVVDFSKYMNRILEVNPQEKWARVQPGVIRDELNHHLNEHGLFFAPETSTANRAMLGGMLGNNSCGANSIVYGSTRDHILSIKTILSDGSTAEFSELDHAELEKKQEGNGLEARIYEKILARLSDTEVQNEIKENYPKASVTRRNTGYGVDMLIRRQPFDPDGKSFSLIDILAGSEGTLSLSSEIKVSLSPLPLEHKALVCIHFEDLIESLEATVTAMEFSPTACELMDHYILERTRENLQQRQNRFFVEGDPKAVLVVEFAKASREELERSIEDLIKSLKENGKGYSYPKVRGSDMKKVWELRKAGLGLLSNMPGDAKPVPVIEDTAVAVKDLPQYIREFNGLLKEKGLYSVHYAHAGAGELHLRPILDLKSIEGQKLFRECLEDVATLVKKYEGSLSGEHGDGRLRGEYIPKMVGEKNYELLKEIKALFDPNNIFNPGKIVDTAPMDSSLRFKPGQSTPEIKTTFDFTENQGFIRAAEQCNGSGDCRKLALSGGTMCPSYMATRNEKDTTRARANALREYLSFPGNRKDNQAIKEAMDLCLSCKGCKSECPSNVDMAKLKAEWEQQEYEKNGVPFRTMIISRMPELMKLGSKVPILSNAFTQAPFLSFITKSILGFSQKRSIPKLSSNRLYGWYKKSQTKIPEPRGTVVLFIDEFSEVLDVKQGKAVIQLLWALGYNVECLGPMDSGRTLFSKGMVKKARTKAEENIKALKDLVSAERPLVGIEPSAILSFRDEYPSVARGEIREASKRIAESTFTLEEFICQEINNGNISPEDFKPYEGNAYVHGHCHQKALSGSSFTKKALEIIPKLEVEEIPSGCCGMAGSFGYMKDKYEVSQKIGELVLFPTLRKTTEKDHIIASGTSCRHQIKDGTGKHAIHPAELLYQQLRRVVS